MCKLVKLNIIQFKCKWSKKTSNEIDHPYQQNNLRDGRHLSYQIIMNLLYLMIYKETNNFIHQHA